MTQLGPYAGSDVIDSHTVRVNYSQPFGAAVASYAEGTLCAGVTDRGEAVWATRGFACAPVGAGPFRFVSWDEGAR